MVYCVTDYKHDIVTAYIHILYFMWVANSVSINKLVSNLAHNKNDVEKN